MKIVKAEETYYEIDTNAKINGISDSFSVGSRTASFNFVYEDPNELQYPVPENTYISKSAFQYVINAMQAGNVTLFASQGYAIDQLVSDTFSILFNSYIYLGNVVDNFIVTPHTIKYYLHHWDGADVPSNEKMYTWRFSYLGCSVDLALTPSGDFTYTSENGHTEHVSNYRHTGLGEELVGKAIQDQGDPDAHKINTPFLGLKSFSGLQEPYIEGKKLHFFYYVGTTKHEIVINDFTEVSIATFMNEGYYNFAFVSPYHYCSGTLDGSNTNFNNNYGQSYVINNENIIYSGNVYISSSYFIYSLNPKSVNLPSWKGNYNIWNPINSYNLLGVYNDNYVNGSGNIYLKSITFSDIPIQNRPEIPLDLPIPTDQVITYPDTELPDQPDGNPVQPEPFIPENPINVPGVPINPTPIPLPPYISIVSGNDDLWGNTIEYENIQEGLLPYMSGLSEFTFPSFTNLISDFSGSLIWVAQIMSVLYNGTSFNVLFIALCLFSLVSILIGAYKLWATTEPDPNNPGFRRSKRPPKPPKGRRRR